MKTTQKFPLYLCDYGMYFIVGSSKYMFVEKMANGMILARDKFGLDVEFNPCKVVKLV